MRALNTDKNRVGDDDGLSGLLVFNLLLLGQLSFGFVGYGFSAWVGLYTLGSVLDSGWDKTCYLFSCINTYRVGCFVMPKDGKWN